MRSIKFSIRLLLIMLCVSLFSALAVFAVSFREIRGLAGFSSEVRTGLAEFASESSRDALIEQAEDYLMSLAGVQADRYNLVWQRIGGGLTAMQRYMEGLFAMADTLAPRDLTRAYMHLSPNVVRTYDVDSEINVVSHAEALFISIFREELNAVYVGTESGILLTYSAGRIQVGYDYDPRVRPWYIEARESDYIIWTNVYMDAFTGELIVTGAKSFRGSDGEIAGVVAIDVLLITVLGDVEQLRLGETGHTFLLNRLTGNYLVHPTYATDLEVSALDYAGDYRRDFIVRMMRGETGFELTDINGYLYYVAYAPLADINFALGIAMRYDEIIGAVFPMQDGIATANIDADARMQDGVDSTMRAFISLTVAIISISIIVSALLSRSITKPIQKLTNGVVNLGSGDLDAKIDLDTRDEFGVLADCFNKMTTDLRDYIDNLAQVTAEKERINSDLRIATDIQADMLPKIFPPYADREDLSMAAFMQPAKEVGGDFYDFFFLDDAQTKIALVIADVSGKGVPAALFMVIAKILIKNNKDLSCSEILNEVNDLLYTDNNSSMFVTTYFSVLDLTNGKYTYVSAGHNPPILYRADSGELTYLDLPKSPPLGIFPGKKFTAQELTLGKDDAVLLYTDGITEAFNSRSEMYSAERLLNDIAKVVNASAVTVVEHIYDCVKVFSGDEPQSDDITMLFLRYKERE